MLGVCEAGAGIAQVLQLDTRELIEGGVLIELFPDWSDETFPPCALLPSRHDPPVQVRAFPNLCLEVISRETVCAAALSEGPFSSGSSIAS